MAAGCEKGVRVAVVGTGGIGSALLPLLSTMPIRAVTLIDGDTVEEVNLSRQPLFHRSDIGRMKALAAQERCSGISSVEWYTECRFLDTGNAEVLLNSHNVVADCTDDLLARKLLERTCAALRIPLVSGAVHGSQIQVVTHASGTPQVGTSAFFNRRPAEEQEGCDMRQVPAAITTIAAALMAMRIEDLVRGGDGLAHQMDLVDVKNGRWMRIHGPRAGELLDTPIEPVHHA